MPRGPREQSGTNIYHVMIRGINQVQLFYDDEDRRTFIEQLVRYKEECGFELLAWCLMGNHVHLLVGIGDVELPVVIKKLLLSYSVRYNRKYDRAGYLYQDRYKSKAIDDDRYLQAAVRYIHRNPLEAGNGVDYWTSYNDYLGAGGPGITDTGLFLGMLSGDVDRARMLFAEFVASEEGTVDYSIGEGAGRMRDARAIDIIKEVAGVDSCQGVSSLEQTDLRKVLCELRERGLSIRQIARLTGLSRGIVERARPVSREPSP